MIKAAFNIALLAAWMDLGLRGGEFIEADENEPLKQRVGEFFLKRDQTLIDGKQLRPILDRVSFVKYSTTASTFVVQPEQLPINTAMVGVIITYLTDGIPQQVTNEWDLWSDHIQKVSTDAIDPAGGLPSYVTPNDNVLTWTNFLKTYVMPTVANIEEDVYDRLATSVSGDLLSEIYLQNRKSMVVTQAGGARARVKEVEILDVDVDQLDNRPLGLLFRKVMVRMQAWMNNIIPARRRINMHGSSKKGEFFITILGLVFFVQLAACTAHYTINNPVLSTDAVRRFSLEDKPDRRSDELLLILTFSGGGTRAAAFAFGILQTLADTQIMVDGQKRRLLDEVDAISSVSGGSFTAAYYGLFKDRIFEDFETKFLKHNVQSELTRRVFSPFSWPKLASLHYDRSDIAAEYYDELLFEKKTFQDFITSKGPLIAINATNVALGSQFTFIEEEFGPICSDLPSYPVSRAVTASSAVPGAFSSIILKNYAGTCNYRLPEWAVKALDARQVNTRRYQMAKMLSDYQDIEAQPYIHLLDGGISDNLGIRVVINLTYMEGDIWNKLQALDLENTSKLAVITVNAQTAIDTSFSKRDFSIPMIDTLNAVSSIPLDQYSFETMELLRTNMTRWRESNTAVRCGEATPLKNKKQRDTPGAPPVCAVQTYLIEVDFDRLLDEPERGHLKQLPTSFFLESTDVDRLKAAARKILTDSVEFQSLISDMQ